MNILVISNNYPSRQNPNYGAFVYNLIQEFTNQHKVMVIASFKAHYLFKKKQKTYGDERAKVYRPSYLSLSNRKFGFINTGALSGKNYKKSVLRIIRKLPAKPDVIYCHFLGNAFPVIDYAKENNIPLVIASGESTYTKWEKNPSKLNKLRDVVNHIVCVSRENKNQLTNLGFNPEQMTIIPNAVDYQKFTPLDKKECKEKLAIDSHKFTVGFIGHYIHRKGPNRIIKAIKRLEDADIELICVGGKGGLESNSFTLELGKVPNYQLPELYNAFDIFVLPTLHEGSCNVIEEAKACGIPIVSSKGTSVEEQLDESIGILVDPLNVDEIAQAIMLLKENKKLREKMQQNLLNRRGENSLENRAEKIIKILQNVKN